MQNQLFRQRSIDKISSPEQLHDYMRVTSPKLWMILAAIAVLLIGFIVYASTATMENTMTVQAEVTNYPQENGERDCLVSIKLPIEQKELVAIGMTVRLADQEGVIDFIFETSDGVGVSVHMNHPNPSLPDGVYDASIVLETTTPISFLLN